MRGIKILFLSMFLFLAACTHQEIVPVDSHVENDISVCRIEYDIHPPEPLVWEDIYLKVLTKEVILDMIEKDQDLTVIALSPEDYEKLSRNMGRIEGFVKYNRDLFLIYKEYFSKPDKIDEK